MQIFFSVLSAILAARVIEWAVIAAIKTYYKPKPPEL